MLKSNVVAISVLVPIYNVQSYLKECLDSICAQTFENFEVICINDGSTDDSRDIIVSYREKDPRFKLVDKPNSGYGDSMNCGIEAARGTYIAILESDDFYAPEALERLHAAALLHDAQVVKGNCSFYRSGPPKKNTFMSLVPKAQINGVINTQIEREIFYLQPSVWSALYRRDFLEDNNIRFLATPGASYQDTAFNFKVWANVTKGVFLKDALVHYRQDNENSSINSRGKVYCVCDEYAEMDRYLKERATEAPAYLMAIKAKMKYNTYMWNYERLAKEFQLEFIQRMSKEMAEEVALGHLDWTLFEEWKAHELKTILNSPEAYHQQRMRFGTHSKFGKAMRYLRIGGAPLLARVLKNRFMRRY